MRVCLFEWQFTIEGASRCHGGFCPKWPDPDPARFAVANATRRGLYRRTEASLAVNDGC